MTKTRLLLVEDDPNLGDILQEYLMLKGYATELCVNGQEGYELFMQEGQIFDMCILDVMMPIMDGFTLAEKIRAKDSNVPIIFLTAKSMKADKVEGFRAGADDYMTKPFSMEELQLRIEAIMRRFNHQRKNNVNGAGIIEEFEIGQFKFNPILQTLQNEDGTKKLTTKESALLKMLSENKNQVLRRDLALRNIWGEDNYFTGRSMDVFITKLRKHLRADEKVSIVNVHGKGYKLIDI